MPNLIVLSEFPETSSAGKKGIYEKPTANKKTNRNVCECVLSRVRLFAIPWTVARRALRSMRFSRQEYWSGLPFPSLRDLANPGINLLLLCLLHWQADSWPLSCDCKRLNAFSLRSGTRQGCSIHEYCTRVSRWSKKAREKEGKKVEKRAKGG